MSKILYIIPGWEDTCSDGPYKCIADSAREKGYEVICKNVDWKKPLSQQIFEVPKDAVIFGFSLGAVLARLVAQKYPCEHLILASATPDHNFINPEVKKALIDLAGFEFVEDAISHLTTANLAAKQTVIYGELEDEPGDISVPNTEHELTDDYITEIRKLL